MIESIARRFPSRARLRPVAIVISLLLAMATGCAGSIARKAREKAPSLEYGRTIEDTIHCDRGACENWYRLVVRERRTVTIEADAPADLALPDFGLSLLDADLTLVGDEREDRVRPRRIRKELAPGLYYVHVWGQGDNRDQLSYKLATSVQRTSRRSTAAKSKSSTGRSTPKPQPKAPVVVVAPPISGEILEVEREGGEPTAVLLGLTLSDGMRPGMGGRLVEAGEEIGRLEIVDVYSAGSRARIVGGLSAPITLDTQAEIDP